MTYLNIQTTVLRHDAMTDATSAQKGVWLTLMGYCVEQENGGRIRGVFAWNEIKVAKALGVAKTELLEASPLWSQKGDDLELEFYPREKQRIVQAKRKSAHAAAIARWANRAKPEPSSDASEESEHPSDNASVIGSVDGMRKGMEEKRREENGISPLPPLGEAAGSEQLETVVGAEVPGDEEVIAWCKAWPGDMARAIPAGIPDGYALNWLAWRHSPSAGPWPPQWRDDLQRRFVRDWLQCDPRARGMAGASNGNGRPEFRNLPAQIRAIEQELAEHPGNPDSTRGTAQTKKERRPDYREKCRRLEELRRQLSTGGVATK